MPTTASAWRAPRLIDIWIFIIDCARIPVLTGARRTRPTSIRRRSWRRPEFSAAGYWMRLWSGYALPASHPTPGALERTKPGGTPLIIRGKLFRQPEPAQIPNSWQNSVILSPSRARETNFSRSSMGLDTFQSILRPPQMPQLCYPCARNELSPFSQEGQSWVQDFLSPFAENREHDASELMGGRDRARP